MYKPYLVFTTHRLCDGPPATALGQRRLGDFTVIQGHQNAKQPHQWT